MGLKVSDWIALLCVCAMGIEYSYAITAEINEMMNNCPRGGGYCINIIPPRPIQRRRKQQRRRPGTRTRKGRRRGQGAARTPKPDPASLGQQHNRLPAAAGGGRAVAATPAMGGVGTAYPQTPGQLPQQQPRQQQQQPFSFFDSLFGVGNPSDPFGGFFGMNMFLRKKRQAAEPGEFIERPRIRQGQNTFNFINTHCRKSEFDFSCRNTGGMCCMPHL